MKDPLIDAPLFPVRDTAEIHQPVHETWQRGRMRTKLSICRKKARFPSEQDALLAARRIGAPLRPYRCDRCRQFHLTSRTKGKRMPRPADEPLP